MTRVVVIGGGVGGLTAAHELAARGFAVEVFERGAVWGGKARSMGRWGTGTDGRHDLPGEHGFRFFPGFYKHVPDTMSRIPYGDAGGTVLDNLNPTTTITMAQVGRPAVTVPARFPRTLRDWVAVFHFYAERDDLGLDPGEARHFAERILHLQASCPERRLAIYEKIPWWDYIGAATRSPQYQKLLARGLTRSLVAMKAEVAATRTVGDMLIQILIYIIRPGTTTDRVLNGPTSEVWIDPWVRLITRLGATLTLETALQAFLFDGQRVTGVRVVSRDGTVRDVEADYVVSALPVEVMQRFVTPEMARRAPTLATLGQLDVEWMNGIVFYLKRDVPIAHGHVILADSAWALTCISQPQFWTGVDLASFGEGNLKGIISVDISDWTAPGTCGVNKPAAECSAFEIAQEAWAQLTAALPDLSDDDLLYPLEADSARRSWFLDPDIETRAVEAGGRGPDPTLRGSQPIEAFVARAAAEPDRNAEPLLINKVGAWAFRPEADTGIPNLVLASDYVRTYSDLACMEGANEAGRRAANAVVAASGCRAEPCRIWPLSWLGVFAPFRALDWVLYKLHLPQMRWGWLWRLFQGASRLRGDVGRRP